MCPTLQSLRRRQLLDYQGPHHYHLIAVQAGPIVQASSSGSEETDESDDDQAQGGAAMAPPPQAAAAIPPGAAAAADAESSSGEEESSSGETESSSESSSGDEDEGTSEGIEPGAGQAASPPADYAHPELPVPIVTDDLDDDAEQPAAAGESQLTSMLPCSPACAMLYNMAHTHSIGSERK